MIISIYLHQNINYIYQQKRNQQEKQKNKKKNLKIKRNNKYIKDDFDEGEQNFCRYINIGYYNIMCFLQLLKQATQMRQIIILKVLKKVVGKYYYNYSTFNFWDYSFFYCS